MSGKLATSHAGWTLHSATEAFLELERDLCLLSGPLARLWEGARFRVHQRLLVLLEAMDLGQPQYREIQPNPVYRAAAYARNALRRPSLLARGAQVLAVSHPRRHWDGRGTWTDPYLDPVLLALGLSHSVIEPPHLGSHSEPSLIGGVRFLDDVELLSEAIGRMRAPFLGRELRSAMSVTDCVFRRVFGVDVGVASELTRAYAQRSGSLRLYEVLLRRVRPRVVVLVVSYGKESLIEVAKSLGIPVIEMQHGTVHPYHMGYCFPGRPKETFPDYLLTFGEYWRSAAQIPLPESKVVSTGFSSFDAARTGFQRSPADAVLFVSQPSIGAALSRMAVEFQESSRSPVIFKLHPSEFAGWRERYPWLVGPGVEVVADRQTSLYDLFRVARAQVGVYSTALYEGLGLGVPTVVAALPGAEASAPLVRGGFAASARTGAEVSEALGRHPGAVNAELFFRSNALQRTVSVVREIAGC